MTIVVAVQVKDGVVLAADSATTLIDSATGTYMNVYNNANKIVNLRKGLPIGVAVYGSASLGDFPISLLLKELRERFTNGTATWKIKPGSYKLADVASLVRQYLFDEIYAPLPKDKNLGLFVVGYSSGQLFPETYQIIINKDQSPAPHAIIPIGKPGLVWQGQPEPIQRLVNGYSYYLAQALIDDFGVDATTIEQAMLKVQAKTALNFTAPQMPIQDAIDLAIFLSDVTANTIRFVPGHQTVGGIIEVAAITKHEGFKWIKRKHYYTSELNP